jgi:hypothetical protein
LENDLHPIREDWLEPFFAFFIQVLFLIGTAMKLTRIELAGINFVSVILVTDSVHGQFVLTPVPSLPAVASGSVAWGDYDNDGWQDFLLSGLRWRCDLRLPSVIPSG